jgi:preprotein translocase subunit SecG
VTKSTALATLVLLGGSKKRGGSPTSRSSGYFIHNHLVSRPLSRSTLVLFVSWICYILWTVVWRPLSRVPERLELGAPCLHKRVDSELRRYPSLEVIVAMPSCCHPMGTYKVVLPWCTTSAREILEDNHMNPRLLSLSVGCCPASMFDLISPCGVVNTHNLMCGSPLLCLI